MNKIFSKIKLILRANKYKNRDDVGGIAYLNEAIKKGDTVFDIGSHKAGFLYFMQQLVGKNGKVYAFEPQTMLYKYIKNIIILFDWHQVQVFNIALSNETTETKLYIPPNATGAESSPGATIVPQFENIENFKIEAVKTQTLDDFCSKHDCFPKFLKIDVEGNELKVLMGGKETIRKNMPKILIEIEARHIGENQVFETIKWLIDNGYKGYFLKDKEKISVEKFEISKHQDVNRKPYCNNFVFESNF